MKCCCCLYSILLLALLGLVRNSLCQELQYSDIARYPNRNNQVVVSQAEISAATPVIGSTGHDFDERISDLIAGSVLNFAHFMGKHLGEQNNLEKYEVFSPVSIMSALALLMLGAKGRSYEELKPVFGLNSDAELSREPSKFHSEFGLMLEDLQQHVKRVLRPRQNAYWRQTAAAYNIRNGRPTQVMEHITKIANGIFTQNGFSLNPDYKSTINSVYHSLLATVDFAHKPSDARHTINQWVGSSTYGKIPNIISGNLPRDTNVILASALYFKGFWENSFLEAATIQDSFFPDGMDQAPINVKMMATAGVFPFYDAVEYDCRIIGLPYQDNVTTMYVILPNKSSRKKLKELQRSLDAAKIENMISRMTKKSAVIAFPKMHLKRTINMKDTLSLLGIKQIFASGISDLSLIGSSAQGAQDAQVAQAAVPLKLISAKASQLKPVLYKGIMTFDRFGESFETTPAITISSRWLTQYDDSQNIYSHSQTPQRRILKRQVPPLYYRDSLKNQHLNQLENDRVKPTAVKSEFFVQDIVHQLDIEINERGTEAAAATLTYFRRSGTDVLFRADTPFMFLIRHDPTKLVTFYGIINEPE